MVRYSDKNKSWMVKDKGDVPEKEEKMAHKSLMISRQWQIRLVMLIKKNHKININKIISKEGRGKMKE